MCDQFIYPIGFYRKKLTVPTHVESMQGIVPVTIIDRDGALVHWELKPEHSSH